METELQRRWKRATRNGTVGGGRGRRSGEDDSRIELDIYSRLRAGLDTDLHIVPPEVYENNKLIFDSIRGVGYLVRRLSLPGELDWVWLNNIESVGKRIPDLEVLNKVYIVRVRTPWSTTNTEWMATEAEVEEHAGDLEIIDRRRMVRPKGTSGNGNSMLISDRAYKKYADDLEVIDVAYLVMWANPESPTNKLRQIINTIGSIDKNSITRVLSI